jgi:hypothetical protein
MSKPKHTSREQLLRLRSVLDFDPASGRITWKTKYCQKIVVGAEAGVVDRYGYRIICVDGLKYFAHRIVWAFVHDAWPPSELDHRDGNPSNNSISNLRIAKRAQNLRNQGLKKTNSSGHKGVSWNKTFNKWQARIQVDKKQIWLGLHDSLDDAAKAYERAAKEHHGSFARLY